MLPIRDTIPSKNHPVVNNGLIGINILFFLVQLSQGQAQDQFAYLYGLVPARYFIPHVSAYFSFGQQVLSFFTFMFMHGGFLHLLGNMWFLYIFGDNVEDQLGPLRYLIFYLLCGLTSGVSHIMLNPHSNVPVIGASGAIAGVMGAYFILYPRAKILTLIPIIIIPWFIEIPAFIFLGLWFALQMFNAAGSTAGTSDIAWWAHVGGFISGMVYLKLFMVFPQTGATESVRKATLKKKTDRLQLVQPSIRGDEANLYGQITISYYESLTGTYKLVNIPWGFHKRIFRVAVPAGVREGSTLRLKGLGKMTSQGGRGDLFLKVRIQPQ